jgi:enoyl-CoA hydratase/carnithine racemase
VTIDLRLVERFHETALQGHSGPEEDRDGGLSYEDDIGCRMKNAIRTITLNRPERRNAMTPQMQMELDCRDGRSGRQQCRVVVLRGAGDAFCSGLDLSALQSMRQVRGRPSRRCGANRQAVPDIV